ncbi:hypothetical protein [Opitutus terrae]|uniref:Uncharacterized protein n=1 Tax=Opitutus terrae (strain DSM 11246 / JCM 15787 / PB90-1) TaxID=452637 RepID=B1ZPM5_OPITP|nr:hypothetical protein [Opitutus terrae]ACB74544.1 hypothetical protein Oter_1259 [Opitutus terrae PB90-1]
MRLGFKTHWADRLQGVLHRRDVGNGENAPADGRPVVPVDKAWDEAFLRVESYLRAHHLESRVLLSRLTGEIIQAARELATQLPAEPPVTVALRVAHARIGEWLQTLLHDGNWADERFRARGRLALLMSELPQHCPERFLAAEPPPAPIAQRLASASLLPAPELRPTPMPPAMLEFPLAEMAEEKWVTFSRSTFTRSAASWVLFIGLLGVAWFATR